MAPVHGPESTAKGTVKPLSWDSININVNHTLKTLNPNKISCKPSLHVHQGSLGHLIALHVLGRTLSAAIIRCRRSRTIVIRTLNKAQTCSARWWRMWRCTCRAHGNHNNDRSNNHFKLYIRVVTAPRWLPSGQHPGKPFLNPIWGRYKPWKPKNP